MKTQFKAFIFMFVILLIAVIGYKAEATLYGKVRKDLKLPNQVVPESQNFGTPVAASAGYLKSGFAGPTTASGVTLSSFLAQPDVPRVLTITPGGTTADVASCAIVVSGRSINDALLTNTINIASQASSIVTSSAAFKSVSSVVFPDNCEKGGFAATWSIGIGGKLGLRKCVSGDGYWLQSMTNGVYDSTRAVIVASASNIAGNTASFATTLDGSKTINGFFFQNFLCP